MEDMEIVKNNQAMYPLQKEIEFGDKVSRNPCNHREKFV